MSQCSRANPLRSAQSSTSAEQVGSQQTWAAAAAHISGEVGGGGGGNVRLERLNGRQTVGCVLGDDADKGNHGETAQHRTIIVKSLLREISPGPAVASGKTPDPTQTCSDGDSSNASSAVSHSGRRGSPAVLQLLQLSGRGVALRTRNEQQSSIIKVQSTMQCICNLNGRLNTLITRKHRNDTPLLHARLHKVPPPPPPLSS